VAKIKKVYINVCSRRAPEWGMILTLQNAMQYAAKHRISTNLAPRVGESLICRARNNSLINYMETECDYLLTVDDDIEIPVSGIVKLIKADKDIIAGFYRLKDKDEAHTAIRMPKERQHEIPDFPEIFKKNLVVPAKYVSTGCLLVKRSVFLKMIGHYKELHYTQNLTKKQAWALYMPMIHADEYLSEDWAFCQRAEDVGFEIWAHGGVRCGHWGLIKYDFEEEEKNV
jgi:hypothetical protein